MFKRFITRHHKYAAKLLKTGAMRVYINNKDALQKSSFIAGSLIKVKRMAGRIEVRLCESGTKRIMDTGRGELLELKDKETAKALNGASHVTVTFREGVIIIAVHADDIAQQERVNDVLYRLKNNLPLRTACFFTGLGMLSYHIKQGLLKQGIETEIVFANDNSELAMSCNLEGNPMWNSASDDAMAVVDSIANMHNYDIPQHNIATVSYPCLGFSLLIDEARRDLQHPICGDLFIPLVNALKKGNPAAIIFENTPRFIDSQTLQLIERSFPGYTFSKTVLDGHDFNELESRKRACIVAISKGLNAFDVDSIKSLYNNEPKPTVNDYLEPISEDAPCYREMAHVKKRDLMPNVGYRNCIYTGDETSMTTIPASYGSPKAGTPMIAHPTNPLLQRQVQPNEHANLRQLPAPLKDVVLSVWKGAHSLVSSRGSASAAHRLLGNGVSKKVWTSLGSALGGSLNNNIELNYSGL